MGVRDIFKSRKLSSQSFFQQSCQGNCQANCATKNSLQGNCQVNSFSKNFFKAIDKLIVLPKKFFKAIVKSVIFSIIACCDLVKPGFESSLNPSLDSEGEGQLL